jgi:hypothetical protein
LVTCNYRTSNDSIFYRDNGYDRFDTKSILLDAAFSVEVLMVGPQMAAPQVAVAVSKAQCRLQVAPRLVACTGSVGGAGVVWIVGVAGVTRKGETEASSSGGVSVARNVGSTGWVTCTVGDGGVAAVGGEFGDDAGVAGLGEGERRSSSSPS